MKRRLATSGNAFARFGMRYGNLNRISSYRGGTRL